MQSKPATRVCFLKIMVNLVYDKMILYFKRNLKGSYLAAGLCWIDDYGKKECEIQSIIA